MNEKLAIIFFWLAFMTYAAAFIFYLYMYINKRQLMSTIATSLTALGLVFQTVSMAERWRSIGDFPLEGAFESYFIYAWVLVFTYLLLELFTKMKILGAWVLPIVGTLFGIAWVKYESPARLSEAVKSTWIIMHVSVIFLAYAGFTIAAALALLYLIQQKQLKKRAVNVFFRRLPSLEVLDEFSNKAITFSLPFLTMTIITGVIRAVKEFPDWYFDPIVISTSLTWAIYGGYLILRYGRDWQGRRVAYIAIGGFASIFLIQIMKQFPVFHGFG